MKNKSAVTLGRLGGLAKKTMTPKAIKQRADALKSRWRKYRARNRRKPKTLRNVALLVAAIALIGSGVLIYICETNPPPTHGYAVKLPGGIEIHP